MAHELLFVLVLSSYLNIQNIVNKINIILPINTSNKFLHFKPFKDLNRLKIIIKYNPLWVEFILANIGYSKLGRKFMSWDFYSPRMRVPRVPPFCLTTGDLTTGEMLRFGMSVTV